ncbi:MAG: RNA-binding protein [Candidatus Rokubacteria bacterium]|nr:RNA-binding protein [Candidatus Rokubacteria bacterium]
MPQKLFIGGLSYNTTTEELRELFAQVGSVVSADIATDRFSGRSRGFGFVEMESDEDAQRAIAQLNGREVAGRRLSVEISRPKAEAAGGGARGGGRRGGGWR